MINTKHGRFASAFWRFLGVFLLSVPIGSNAVEISNGVPEGTVGHYRVDVQTGGDTRTAVVTAKGLESGSVLTVDVVFDYSSFVDPGIDGQAFRLSDTAETGPTQDPNTPNVVSSSGSFMAANGNMILWTGISTIQPGSPVFQTRYTFSTDDGRPLGPLRVLQYLDEDALTVSDNVFLPIGSPSTANLSLFTLDNTEVFGVSQSGAFISAPGFLNASFAGWAVGQFPLMASRITGAGQSVSVQGVIDDGLPSFAHSELGTVFGPRDITSVLAWDVDPSAVDAEITTSLDGEPAVVEAQAASTAIPCQGKSCRVLIVCISADVAVPCNNRITISARPPRRSSASRDSGHLGDDTSTKARMFPFASGNAANIPQGQTANVKLKLTKRGRQVARSGIKKLRGVMNISNVAGFAALRIPVKIKFK